jgi:uncharacterized protein
MVNRPGIIEFVRRFYGTPLVKVLTGIRRSGKTSLLKLIQEDMLRQGVPADALFWFSTELLDSSPTLNAADLMDRIRTRVKATPKGKGVVLLDEVQDIVDWERLVASLIAEGCWDVYITGSNSRLLGSELSSRLSGRYVEIPVYTLGLSEYIEFASRLRPALPADPLAAYLAWGGFPGLLHLPDDPIVLQSTLSSYMDSLVLRDVIQRHRIRDADTLLRILRFCVDNVGSLVSCRAISAFFKNQGLLVSVDTVQNYLGYLCQAYILFQVRRYDLKGKRHLEHQEKYYLGDLGLKAALLGTRERDISGLLENAVFLELKRRGYQASVGASDNLEIDFVAEQGGERAYYQVSYLIANDAVRDREFGNLARIKDNWPKYVLSMDSLLQQNAAGIKHIHIKDWLLGAQAGKL